MRGYPYWPAVVTRDPNNGEYASFTDAFFKPLKKFHVLFLEYGNQRAWVNSASIKQYKGIEQFHSDKARATKSQRPDYTPNKRHVEAFNKAVSYAEELRGGPDEDRLERVLLRYGWVMVGEAVPEEEPQQSGSTSGRNTGSSSSLSSSSKRRKQSAGPPPTTAAKRESEEQVNRSTDSETDGHSPDLKAGASPMPEAAKVRGSGTKEKVAARSTAGGSGRRSSTEAESRLDPDRDDPEVEFRTKEPASGHKVAEGKIKPETASSLAVSKPPKRQSSSSRGAGLANGGSESGNSGAEETDEIRPPPAKKKPPSPPPAAVLAKPAANMTDKGGAEKPAVSASRPAVVTPKTLKAGGPQAPARTPAPSVVSPMAVPVPRAAPVTPSGTGDREEFPRVGDLVWGRMAGFPFWPAFVTRSPEGTVYF